MGNLHPGSKAALTLKYVQELPLEVDEALYYVLPAVLNFWYQLSGEYLLFFEYWWWGTQLGKSTQGIRGAKKYGKRKYNSGNIL